MPDSLSTRPAQRARSGAACPGDVYARECGVCMCWHARALLVCSSVHEQQIGCRTRFSVGKAKTHESVFVNTVPGWTPCLQQPASRT